jgi:hypothetical protein
MATLVTTSGEQTRGLTDSPQAKGNDRFIDTWKEYFRLLLWVAAVGGALVLGPVLSVVGVTYVAYLLSRLLGA